MKATDHLPLIDFSMEMFHLVLMEGSYMWK